MKVSKVTKLEQKYQQYDITTLTGNFYVSLGDDRYGLIHNSPSIVFGPNPDNGKFFVGTKGAFANTPKLNYTGKDIDANHPNPDLRNILKTALEYLPGLKSNDVLQGDMMYIRKDLKVANIDGQSYVVFKPNTLTYAVPQGSDIAQKIKGSQIGIVIHTKYTGKSFADLKATFGFNSINLTQTPSVWFQDAILRDYSGTVTFTAEETTKINDLLDQIRVTSKDISPRFFNQLKASINNKIYLKTYYNSNIRNGGSIPNPNEYASGFLKWLEDKLNKDVLAVKSDKSRLNKQAIKKEVMDFWKSNKDQVVIIAKLQSLVVEAKLLCLSKFNAIDHIGAFTDTSNGYKLADPEGVVITDHLNNTTLKLVDRLNFSRQNFLNSQNR